MPLKLLSIRQPKFELENSSRGGYQGSYQDYSKILLNGELFWLALWNDPNPDIS